MENKQAKTAASATRKRKKTYRPEEELDLKLLVTLSRCMQTVHRFEVRTIRSGGLTLPQFGVLEVLYHKGPLCISEIIEKTLSSGGNMTVVIENLLRDGLIERNPSPEDRRKSLIHLSRKGEELMQKHFPEHIKNIQEIFQILSNNEKNTLIRLSKKLGLHLSRKK